MPRPGMDSSLVLSRRAYRLRRYGSLAGRGLLLLITSSSVFAVLFIFYYIARDAIPFFQVEGFREFLTSTHWFPTGNPPEFGAAAIFYGTAMVTFGAVVVAVPLGISAAVCLSDVLPFSVRQTVKPVIEMLAAIPSVAFGFFALVVLAPLLQQQGGRVLALGVWLVLGPPAVLFAYMAGDAAAARAPEGQRLATRAVVTLLGGGLLLPVLIQLTHWVGGIQIQSGTNALNVSVILGIMAVPTVVSVSEDALQAVGRELREGSYALGATRAETIVKVVMPAAASGIVAAAILGVMRAVGETMVVWMASGNASRIPDPWYNFLQPIRTLTATIAGDMGEADHVTGSSRYAVLFAMALSLLVISFLMNLASEAMARRIRRRQG
jgi:phosphate transport system permease protein